MRSKFRSVRFLLVFLVSVAGFTRDVTAQAVSDLIDSGAELSLTMTETTGKTSSQQFTTAVIDRPFTGIALQLGSLAEQLNMQARFVSGSESGDWIDLHVVASATGGTFTGGFHGLEVFEGVRVEVRVTGDSAVPPEIHGFGVFDNRADTDGVALPVEPLRSVKGNKSGTIIPPPLITRAEWGAEAFIGTPSRLANPDFRFMTFHHAAGYSAETLEEGLAQVYAIQDLHQNVRGWSDIGYQFVIDRAGRLYQGRPFLDGSTSLSQVPELALGAHVGGANSGNIGVSMLGCYHPPEGSFCEQEPTQASIDTYVTLFAFLSERYGIEPTLIRGHRDFSSTACPGNNNYALLPQVINDVEDLLITGNEALGVAELTAENTDDGLVQISWSTLEDFGIEMYRVERDYLGQKSYIYESTESPGTVADDGVTREGPVTYNLYAVGSGGREQLLDSAELEFEIGASYTLAEVFPNPTGSDVRIRYKLRHDGYVLLSVYDAGGRELVSRDMGYERADRWYSTQLDMSPYASGIYYYRVVVEGFAGIDFDKTRSFALIR